MNGSLRDPTRRATSVTNRVTPTPPGPSMSTAVVSPLAAISRAGASLMNSASRPTNRALSLVAGMPAILGAAPDPRPARTDQVVLPCKKGLGARSLREEGGQDVVVDVRRPGGARGRIVADDVAQGHLVEPALASIRTEDEPVGPGTLQQLDLVALVQL